MNTPNAEAADLAQRIAELKTTPGPFVGYVSCDGKSIQTWPGGHLMTVTSAQTCRLSQWSYIHGKTWFSYRAKDVHGRNWYGRSSPGIAITLRRCKS